MQFWNPIYTAIIQIDSISGYFDDRCTLWLHVSTSTLSFSSQIQILSVLYLSTINVKYYEIIFYITVSLWDDIPQLQFSQIGVVK
jgi:hypothetical protein